MKSQLTDGMKETMGAAWSENYIDLSEYIGPQDLSIINESVEGITSKL